MKGTPINVNQTKARAELYEVLDPSIGGEVLVTFRKKVSRMKSILFSLMEEEDIENHQTRCFRHTFNLAARACLGDDPDSFEREAFIEAAL